MFKTPVEWVCCTYNTGMLNSFRNWVPQDELQKLSFRFEGVRPRLTFIELLVVVVIVALLTLILLPVSPQQIGSSS